PPPSSQTSPLYFSVFLSDTALYDDPSLEEIRSTVARTATTFGGRAASVWTDKWDTFSVHEALVRANASLSCHLTLLVTVSQCHLCSTLQRQSDIEGIYWIGLCHSQGHVTRNDVVRHVIHCHWYYQQHKAIRHLVADMHLNDTVLLYNPEHASTLANEVIRREATMVHLTLISEPEPMTSPHWKGVLFRINKWNQRVYIMSAHVKERAVVLEQALRANLVSPRHHWLIDMTSSNDSFCAVSGDSLVFLALSEDARKSFSLMALVNWMHNNLAEWLVGDAEMRNDTEGMPGTETQEMTRNISRFISSTTPQDVSNDFAPDVVFDLKKCATPRISSSCCKPTTIASYNEVGRVEDRPLSEIFPNKFFGFHGRRLRVVTKTYPPFVKFSNGSYTGMCIDLLDTLARALNF
ncbi:hypothetical protein LSAT2_006845, partial [Lamellibrachia satsuma]